jgi:hypothetical protein
MGRKSRRVSFHLDASGVNTLSEADLHAVNDHPNGATDVRLNGAMGRGDFEASDGVIISCFRVLFQALICRPFHRAEFGNFYQSSLLGNAWPHSLKSRLLVMSVAERS